MSLTERKAANAARNTLAAYERIIKAAARQGLVATRAIRYPDGRVEFIFGIDTAPATAVNPWD